LQFIHNSADVLKNVPSRIAVIRLGGTLIALASPFAASAAVSKTPR
jgi:ABC-type Fe2+-enterobactin transport system substrate-binding protein